MARHLEKMSKNGPLWTVLSVQNPWSDLICRGLKDVENRSWPTDYRGRLYIHSSGSPMTPVEAKHELGASVLRDSPEVRSWLQEGMSKGATESWLTSRAIIGYVEIVDCVRDSTSSWAEEDQYHWVLADPKLFDEPMTDVPGQLKIWTFDPEKHRNFGLKRVAVQVEEEVREPPPRSYASHPFTTTDHQAVFWAWDLSKQSQEDGYARIAGSMMGAQVDLNPHQVDAALFALKSPLSKGVLLADEVGLGKTIEAGIVIAQRWAERKRRILLVVPATLRKQWSSELADKFFLPSVILESKSWKEAEAGGKINPFDRDDAIILTSYQFAARKAGYIQQVGWNLVVIDEAHRVRNSWQKKNIMGRALKEATAHARKILLTATPLQNSAMELFGLLSFIDPRSFGSEESFRAQYLSLADEGRYKELRKRIEPFFYRTLRRQVLEYIQYTKRIALTETYAPGEEEQSFYDDFTEWLSRKDLFSVPASQRALLTLVLHKLLASSTFAVQNALDRIEQRLMDLSAEWEIGEVLDDLDGVDAESEEWDEENGDPGTEVVDHESLARELSEIRDFKRRVRAISTNAKGDKLLTALELGFRKMQELGAADKAIIFTESKRTQKYLQEILAESVYAGSVVLFNGENKDPESRSIYKAWLAENQGSDRITGSASSDMRAALVDHFKHSAKIMIATEAAAEGVNLQFCSLVINYDLPWNPQRIEQRIGRCHRYGQKLDVVVVNFLNTKNRADERVYELLKEKLKLFDGVFGASDEVLGALGSGVDFEKRILGIYQSCRTRDQIDSAFGQLQLELDETISQTMTKTQVKVLENLDEEVHSRLKLRETEARALMSSQARALYYLTKHLLGSEGDWNDEGASFSYQGQSYRFKVEEGTVAHAYRVQHPLAQALIERARNLRPEGAELSFYYTGMPVIGALEDFIGKSGWMQVEVMTRASKHETEEILIVGALTDDGAVLYPDVAQKLFQLPAESRPLHESVPEQLQAVTDIQSRRTHEEAQQRQQSYFSTEIDKLDLWAEDLKNGLELRIKELEVSIKETKKASTLAITLEDKLALQKQVKELEAERNQARKRLFDAQDEIDAKRDEIIGSIEEELKVSEVLRQLQLVRWRLA
jgi:adenine-specific DNA-methyltransferase